MHTLHRNQTGFCLLRQTALTFGVVSKSWLFIRNRLRIKSLLLWPVWPWRMTHTHTLCVKLAKYCLPLQSDIYISLNTAESISVTRCSL